MCFEEYQENHTENLFQPVPVTWNSIKLSSQTVVTLGRAKQLDAAELILLGRGRGTGDGFEAPVI